MGKIDAAINKANYANDNLDSKSINIKYPPAPLQGAIGDGVTDDTTAIQAIFDYCGKDKEVFIPRNVNNTPYIITNTLQLYSGATYRSNGAIIQMTGVDKPILASRNYFSANGIGPTGSMKIEGKLFLKGDTTKSNNTGLLIRDYYCTIDNVEIQNVGGDGIKFTHLNDVGATTGGNLVENRILNCVVRNAAGTCFLIGEDDNNKITDGFFINNLASASATTPNHLRIGSAAGWKVDGVHTYGTAPTIPIYILNSFYTNVNNIYVEGFTSVGMNFTRIQKALNINNVVINMAAGSSGSKAIGFSKSSLVTSGDINVNNVILMQSATTSVYGLYADTSTLTIHTSNITASGDNKSYITLFSSPDVTKFKRITNSYVDGELSETTNQIGLKYQGVGMAHYATSGNISGNSAKTIDLPISNLVNYRKIIGTIMIKANSFDNGSSRAVWTAQLYVSAKVNGTNGWVAQVDNIIAPTGFAVNPTVTATNISGNSGKITVSFTFTDADATGVVGYIYTVSE